MSSLAPAACGQMWTKQQIDTFVSKLPTHKKQHDKGDERVADTNEKGLKWVIRTLMSEPGKILTTKGDLEKEPEKKPEKVLAGADLWDISVLKKIPDYWWVQWILDASQGKIDKATAQKVVDHDYEVFMQLVEYALQLNLATHLPDACKDKRVCARTLHKRAGLVGNRIQKVVGHIAPDGAVSWGACGCFSFEWSDAGPNGFATKLVHCNGAKKDLPDHIRINRKFTLHDNWSDAAAYVELKPVKYHLRDFFGDAEGPNEYLVKKLKAPELSTLAQVEASALGEEIDKTMAGHVKEDLSMLSEVHKNKQTALTKRARDARQVQQSAKKVRRTIALG